MAYYSSLFKKSDVRITQSFSTTHKALDLSRGVVKQPIYSGAKLGQGTASYTATSYTDSKGRTWTNSWVVYIKYDNGMSCRMFHGYVADAVVKKGQRIKPGDQVYRTGNSGNSNGDHLHYVLLNSKGVAIDPKPYVIEDKVVEGPVVPPELIACQKEVERLKGEITRLNEALGASQASEKVKGERVTFLEGTLAMRDRELIQLGSELEVVKEERNRLEQDKLALELKLDQMSKPHWTEELRDEIYALWEKFKEKILKFIKKG